MSKETYPADAVSVTVLNGVAGLSAEVDLRGLVVVEIVMPGTWTAAAVSFTGSDTTGGTFTSIYDIAGNEYAISAAAALASRRIKIPPGDLLGDCFLKVRSGLTGAAVDQTADRVLVLKCRGLA